jgi:tetratricopeptide (TPR) repeat protein
LALGVLNEYAAAMHDLNYAVRLKGSSPTALLNRGAVLLLQGGNKLGEAQADFTAVLKANPENLPATYYVAVAKYRQQKYDEALADCNKVLQRAPNLRPALLLRVQVALAQRDAKQVLADLPQLSPPGTAEQQAAAQCGLLRRLAAKQTGVAKSVALALALKLGKTAAGSGLKTATLFDDLGAVQMQLAAR